MIRWIGWFVLIVGVCWALLTNLSVRDHYKTTSRSAVPANTFALIQTFSVIVVLLLHLSPFHLLWLFLLSYLLGFLAIRFRPLAVLANAYGYILFMSIRTSWIPRYSEQGNSSSIAYPAEGNTSSPQMCNSEQANLQPDKILFDEAMRYLKEHNFDAALAAMKILTGTYPDSPYTVTAKRMVAEALKVASENRKVREHLDPP